jgi:hypothetical protein
MITFSSLLHFELFILPRILSILHHPIDNGFWIGCLMQPTFSSLCSLCFSYQKIQNRGALTSASKWCIRPYFISIIQHKPAKSLTTILKTGATKQICQSTTKLIQIWKNRRSLVPPCTVIADSQVTSKGSALCASSSVHRHLYHQPSPGC